MAYITIAGEELCVKDHLCAAGRVCRGEDEYPLTGNLSLWLYVSVTDKCPGACPFCVHRESCGGSDAAADPERFRDVLAQISPLVCGVSFTGGEPLAEPELLDRLIEIADGFFPDTAEFDLATGAFDPEALLSLRRLDRLTSVHISRHSADDEKNRRLMGTAAPSAEALGKLISSLKYPEAVVFNCVLQKGGTESADDIAAYLDFAAGLGVKNTAFITMMRANGYCREHYVSPDGISLLRPHGFGLWNLTHKSVFDAVSARHDHNYCSCVSGRYTHGALGTRFYFRCPGEETPPGLCRQLVFGADGRLRDGFGRDRKILI